jgi:hypothetical protein
VSLPHIAFYPGDWRKDIAVQSLSYHHRGIWFEILMLMHCSEQRGRLVLAGKPMPNDAVARLLGLTEQEASNTMEILVASGVASRELDGTLYCRRMIREEERKAKLRSNASKGGSKTQANREANPYQAVSVEGERVLFSPSHSPSLSPKEEEQRTYTARLRVREFARGEGIGEEDADWFFDKGEGNGWRNNGEPIRDWKATLRSWNRAGYLPSQKASGNNSQSYRQKPKDDSDLRKQLARLRDPDNHD